MTYSVYNSTVYYLSGTGSSYAQLQAAVWHIEQLTAVWVSYQCQSLTDAVLQAYTHLAVTAYNF